MNPVAELIQPEVAELIREGRYLELREALHGIPKADVADVMAALTPDQAAIAFRFLTRDDASEAFAYLDAEHQAALIHELGAAGSVRIVEGMDPDDRVRLLDELPPEVAQRLIASLSPEDRKTTQAILGYPPGSVGRLMTPDYVKLMPEWTATQALEHIRKKGRDAETINVVYIVDSTGVLIDDVRLRKILFSDPSATIESLMTRSFTSLRADQDQEEAVRLLTKYDRVALPVVDSRGVLLGIVTHDDIADVAQQEFTEDIQKLGGMQALDEPYMTISLMRLVRKRGMWLAVLFVAGMFTQTAMATFESDIERAAVLATFVPLIVSSGGNSGSQATALIIRAIAVGEIGLRDWWRVLKREVAAGAILGLTLGLLGVLRVHIQGWLRLFERIDAKTGQPTPDSLAAQDHFMLLSVTIGVSVLGVVLWGTVVGSMLPFLLKRLKLDPATSSAPFVATMVDVIGVLLYFFTAVVVLRGTLL
ncbi:MAG: magnesium transporter [Pyrinomonadaceae bacterium]|nr:magnesium transporter [Phycisphaerales bacterium]